MTPPQRLSSGLAMTPAARKVAPLRIDTAAASRENAGLSVTPIGKAAEEFRYYCPLCMMFYRSILELPCCKQSVCPFCFGEYLQKQLDALPEDDGPASAAVAAALSAAPAAAAGGKAGRAACARLVLPAGTACPQCRVACKAGQPLRVLEGCEEQHVKYLDSPQTRAQLERMHKAQQAADSDLIASPLKVGDDFGTMAR